MLYGSFVVRSGGHLDHPEFVEPLQENVGLHMAVSVNWGGSFFRVSLEYDSY